MPTKRRQLLNLGKYVFARTVWLLLAANPRGGAYSSLKRLSLKEVVVLSIPVGMYVLAGVWLYLFFPRNLVSLAVPTVAWGLTGATTLVGSTLLISRVIDWRHYHY